MQKNKSARVVSRVGKQHVHTQTENREDMQVLLTTNRRDNSTVLKIYDSLGLLATFDGRAARTLERVLTRHYDNVADSR